MPMRAPMPTRRGDIHLGDLARALGKLDWQDPAQAETIAACLGFGLGPDSDPAQHRQAPREAYNPAVQPAPAEVDRQPSTTATKPVPVPMPPTPPAPPPLPAKRLTSELQALEPLAPAQPDPDWLGGDPQLLDPGDALPCAREPLFADAASRHIFSAALATRRSGTDIDLPRLIAAITRREPLRALPRRSEPTLEQGCQLLLDYSATMVPFWDDLTDLVRQLGAVVGNTRVYSFDRRPTDALHWLPDGRREPWEPADRPVLVAGDLGIQSGGRRSPDPDWDQLARRCDAAGVPLLVLVPWPEPYWPKTLAGRPILIHWSPATSAGWVSRCLAAAGPG
jgi:hypothetical protein